MTEAGSPALGGGRPLLVELVFTGLPIDRDEVEEALQAAFEGIGEITGAGAGMGRCHLDLEVTDGIGTAEVLRRVDSVLAELGIAEFAQVFALLKPHRGVPHGGAMAPGRSARPR